MPEKVIVVEDDAAFCYAVGKALEQAGFDVETCLGSTEAWPFVGATAKIDLLLTDLLFPKGQPSGVALARSALYHHPGLPIIYMTAFDTPRNRPPPRTGLSSPSRSNSQPWFRGCAKCWTPPREGAADPPPREGAGDRARAKPLVTRPARRRGQPRAGAELLSRRPA